MTPTLSPAAGMEQRELGLFAAEWNNRDWVVLARQAARELCELKGSVSIDDVRLALGERKPSSNHVYGCVFNEPGWRCIGMEPSRIKTNRARRVLRWEWQP